MSVGRDDLLAPRKRSGCLGPCFRRLLGTHDMDTGAPGTDDTNGGHPAGPPLSEAVEKCGAAHDAALSEASSASPSAAPSLHAKGVAVSPAVADLFQFLSRERKGLEVLSPELVDALYKKLGVIQAADLCVRQEDALQLRTGIGYQEVYSSPEMTLCIFLLRAGASIPLHDHPGMHVFCRLLFGRMRILSFDPEPSSDAFSSRGAGALAEEAPCSAWRHGSGGRGGSAGRLERHEAASLASAERAPGLPFGARWASLHSDEVLGPEPSTYSLGPDKGNVHELEAMETCAFFDVVVPPYDPGAGRDCTYYLREKDDGTGRCILLPTIFAHFATETLRYRGPAFHQFCH
mmetsp:Transcript_60053/g.110334  ORF Transcript_60053/g.110334 Transcript_60053/m.110334 type:complete len:347 (+) Transcript_60053:113-1153(+)